MKRLMLLTVFAAAVLSLGLAAGCSDKDNPTDSQQVMGDTSTAGFQAAQGLIGDEADLFAIDDDLNLSFELFNAATGSYPLSSASPRGAEIAALAATDDSIYNIVVSSWDITDDNWFVCSFSASQTKIDCEGELCDTTTFNLSGTDSLQFLLAGVPLDTSDWDLDLDELKARTHGEAGGANHWGDFTAATHRSLQLLRGALANDSLVEVNANESDTLTIYFVGDSGSCDITLTENSSIDGLVVLGDEVPEGECPRAGAASKTATIDLECTGNDEVAMLNIEGAWTLTADVQTDGSVDVRYVNGNTLWQITVAAGNCF
jgi:hypothetical protein